MNPAFIQKGIKPSGLGWGVTDDTEKLLMAPDIVFKWCDVEIAYQDRPLEVAPRGEPGPRFGDEIQLVAIFRVLGPVRYIAPGRHVEVVQFDRSRIRFQFDREVSAIAAATPVGCEIQHFQRQPRQDRDAVVALHAAKRDVAVAERGRPFARKRSSGTLRIFLQADHVRIERGDQVVQQPHPQAERIDVPGSDLRSFTSTAVSSDDAGPHRADARDGAHKQIAALHGGEHSPGVPV